MTGHIRALCILAVLVIVPQLLTYPGCFHCPHFVDSKVCPCTVLSVEEYFPMADVEFIGLIFFHEICFHLKVCFEQICVESVIFIQLY